MKKNILLIFIFIIFSLPSILPLFFNKGFFQSDDGEWMVIRFSAFHQALRDGQFPVRFLGRLNHGYGYPVANFLYPGFMYASEPIHLLGFGFVNTIKIILGLSMIGSAIFCFLWLSKIFNKFSAFIGSMFYLYLPYHLYDIYKRGSVGEILAFGIMPFILWQIERRSFFWTSVGTAFLILSHNTLALLFLPVIIIYLISRGLPFAIYFLPSLVLGLGISSFFWIPAIFDLQYTVFNQTQISEWSHHFTSLDLIGVAPFLIFTWFLIRFDYSNNRTKFFMLAVGTISVFLSLPISSFIWKLLPVAFVQFPFRFLSIAILTVAFLSAFIVAQVKSSNKRLVIALILFIALWFSASPFMKPSIFFDKGEGFYSTNEATTTVQNEYMPKWVKENPKEHFREKVKLAKGQIKDLEIKSNKISFSTNTTISTVATISTVYFPGWNGTIDGKRVSIDYKNKGLIEIKVPDGQHKILVSFSETPLRAASNTISLLSFFVLLFLGIKGLRKSPSV